MDRCKNSMNGVVQPPEASIVRNSSVAISSRVGASASALIHESLLRPDPSSIVNVLASSTAGAGKSNAAQSPSGLSTTCTPPPSARATLSPPAGIGSLDAAQCAFRSHSSSQSCQAVEAQFGSFLAGGQEQSGMETRNRRAAAKDESPQYREANALSLGKGPDILSTFATSSSEVTKKYDLEEDQADGAAVVALLSDPSFIANDMPEYQSMSIDHGCSQIVQGGPRGYVPQTSPRLAYPHGPLSLIPDLLGDPKNPHTEATGQDSFSRTELKDLLVTLPRLANGNGDLQIEPWIEILTRYHDEVWGDIRPYIDAAREEANSLREADNHRQRDCPAIRRLAMVVRHLSSRHDSNDLDN
ncbi:MAG: hypothetical protein Q9196_006377 [Gyalolechia fulgens]